MFLSDLPNTTNKTTRGIAIKVNIHDIIIWAVKPQSIDKHNPTRYNNKRKIHRVRTFLKNCVIFNWAIRFSINNRHTSAITLMAINVANVLKASAWKYFNNSHAMGIFKISIPRQTIGNILHILLPAPMSSMALIHILSAYWLISGGQTLPLQEDIT